MTIGRAGSSDILLDRDDLTSRHHALLKRENDRFLISDRRSANGVRINGLPIQSDKGYLLIDGDHITIGNYELTFRATAHSAVHQVNHSLASSL
jgi:pSer/pThr/pTyr-binding forkhead associated (FHA) protein